MPNIESARKELRKAKKRTVANRLWTSSISDLMKNSKRLIEKKEIQKAEALVLKALQILDKAAQRKVIKKGTADRKKSRLIRKLNQIKK